MELILGLPPMSQYDAGAHPMYHAFGGTADPAPFTRVDARVSLTEMNPTGGADARLSESLDLTEADLAPMELLNQIEWRSVRGPASVAPPPRHAAFIKVRSGLWADDDDDDAPKPTAIVAKPGGKK
jgi:hypothetical protein